MIRHIASSQPPTTGQTLSLFTEIGDLAEIANPQVDPQLDRHLVAARRLAKAIRRLPNHSAEQSRAGQAICRHLIALLDETAQDRL